MRTLLFAAALAFVAAPVSAQTQFIVKGGLNTAFFSGSDAGGTEPRLGAVGGAGLRFNATPSLAVQVEALYSQEGAVEDNGEGTYKLDYLDIPILLRAGIPVSPYADAGIYAGPQIGIPLNATFDSEFGRETDEETLTDIGLAIGADYWSGPFGVDLRYVVGLTDTFDDEIGGLFDPLDIQNQTFTVTLGLRFGDTGARPRGRRY